MVTDKNPQLLKKIFFDKGHKAGGFMDHVTIIIYFNE
jgi:hypothetical protein